MPVLLERERPSEMQLKAVRAYILRRRQQERLALAESKAKEEAALQRKREQEKKKETVEDVKLEINKLEAKLESLKGEKHELFLQLKKVLNEDEQKRQKERQLVPAFHHPMIVNNVHRMPYGMMTPRPFGIMGNTAATQPLRMEIPPGPGGIKQPTSPLHSQVYPYPLAPNQPSVPAPSYSHPNPGYTANADQPYGTVVTPVHVQPEKHFKVTSNQPMAASTTTASVVTPLPLHVVTSYTPSTGSHQSPHNQIIIQQGDKVHPAMKLHSPKPAAPSSTVPHGYPAHLLGDPGLHQGKPLLNTPGTHQQPSKLQYSHSHYPQITSTTNTYPKHDPSHQLKHPTQPQIKQSTLTSYPPKPEPSQQLAHHKSTNKPPPQQVHTKTDIPQHKQTYPSQTETAKQEHIHAVRPQQYSIPNYQQQLGVTSAAAAASTQHPKPPPQSTSYPTKEPDSKQSFQMAPAQQQPYGYSVQQQASFADNQQYLNKSQTPNQATVQVSYPATVIQQQNYPGFANNKDQSPAPQYSQHHGYQVSQQVYSGQQQYQGYLSQQYQAQPYQGYPAHVDLKGQQPQQHLTTTQNYQSLPQSSPSSKSRTSQFDQTKQDQQMPPPPPQKPPPKPEQEHYHSGQQSISKRSGHRYGHPYKREHHSSTSSKPKFSEKYSGSQDDQQGVSPQSSRHHYHSSSSKSSHSKSSGASSSSTRQSRYH